MMNHSTYNSNNGGSPSRSDETFHPNSSTSSLPPPRILLPSRQSSFSSADDSERKGLTPQASYPNLASSSIKSSKKKTASSRRRSFESDLGPAGGHGGSHDERSSVSKPFANEKRNKEFHALFKSVPLEDNLIEDYGCALQKEILLQGRIYITQHHLCFNANIFGWITNLVIAFTDIVEIEKRTTAIFIPNAILISTNQSKHFFASFLSREQAYDQMVTIWRQAQHRVSSSILTTATNTLKESSDDASDKDTDDLDGSDDNGSMSFSEWDEQDHDHNKMKRTHAVDNILALSPPLTQSPARDKDRQTSQTSLPMPHATHDDAEAARRRAISEAGPRPNASSIMHAAAEEPLPLINHPTKSDPAATKNLLPSSTTPPAALQQAPTQCLCGTDALEAHYPSTVMDQTYTCSMETLYNLLYHCGFVAKYLTEVEKSTDVVIHPWRKGDGCPYVRDASYVKYLGGAIGPKSTRCILKDELLHVDLNNHITQQTTTQTPDVPNGGNFCVKTRVCLSWAGQGQVRMLVTVLVPFTKASWLKSTIEKASIDGQINYYKGLDAAIRKYTESRQDSKRQGKRKGKDHSKRTRRKASGTSPPATDIPTAKTTSSPTGALGIVSQWLSDGIETVTASPPTLAQCTILCLVLMVFTNLYIALKMVNMGQQLNPPSSSLDRWRTDHRQDVDSMWQWLDQLEKTPWVSSSRQHEYPSQLFLTDKRQRSNQHLVELEKMVQHTEQSVDHVHRLVKQQRQQLLQHYSP